MKQFISYKVLKVNCRLAPCECEEKKVCEYCLQANLILWKKEKHREEEIKPAILTAVKASGVRKTARLLKIQPSTVTRWIRTKNIPQKYIEKIKSIKVLGGGSWRSVTVPQK